MFKAAVDYDDFLPTDLWPRPSGNSHVHQLHCSRNAARRCARRHLRGEAYADRRRIFHHSGTRSGCLLVIWIREGLHMKRVVSLLVALLPLAALACPLLIPPKRLDLRPTAPPYTGIFRPDISSVAIDGDTV